MAQSQAKQTRGSRYPTAAGFKFGLAQWMILLMIIAAEPLSAFVNAHATVKMLALAFLVMIGVALVADGLHFHIPRGYLYFAIAFSILVEVLNLLARRGRRKFSGSSGGE